MIGTLHDMARLFIHSPLFVVLRRDLPGPSLTHDCRLPGAGAGGGVARQAGLGRPVEPAIAAVAAGGELLARRPPRARLLPAVRDAGVAVREGRLTVARDGVAISRAAISRALPAAGRAGVRAGAAPRLRPLNATGRRVGARRRLGQGRRRPAKAGAGRDAVRPVRQEEAARERTGLGRQGGAVIATAAGRVRVRQAAFAARPAASPSART